MLPSRGSVLLRIGFQTFFHGKGACLAFSAVINRRVVAAAAAGFPRPVLSGVRCRTQPGGDAA